MSVSRPSDGLDREYLASYFDDSFLKFKRALRNKVDSTNQPRVTMRHPGRTFSLNVHSTLFTFTLASHFVEEEVRHKPPCDDLRYEITFFDGWLYSWVILAHLSGGTRLVTLAY